MPRPHLNVLPSPPTSGTAGLVRQFHRAVLQSARSLAEETVLDGGTWLRNPDLQPLAAANCVLEAALEPAGDAAAFVARVGELARDCPVRGWTLSPSLPTDRTAPLADHLAGAGWVAAPLDVLHLTRQRPTVLAAPAGLTIIPARAGFGPYRRLMAGRFPTAVEVEAAVLRLDDAHVDALLALRAGEPVAAVSLLADGETGTVTDLYVAPAHRGRGIGRLLLARALESSGRAGHRSVLAGVAPGSTGLFAATGFEVVGQWVQYVRP